MCGSVSGGTRQAPPGQCDPVSLHGLTHWVVTSALWGRRDVPSPRSPGPDPGPSGPDPGPNGLSLLHSSGGPNPCPPIIPLTWGPLVCALSPQLIWGPAGGPRLSCLSLLGPERVVHAGTAQ